MRKTKLIIISALLALLLAIPVCAGAEDVCAAETAVEAAEPQVDEYEASLDGDTGLTIGADAPDTVDETDLLLSEAAEAVPETAQTPEPITLGVGEKYSLPAAEGATSPIYATSNAKVASVNAKGVVKGKKKGSATVTVTRGGEVLEYPVNVVKAPKKIKFAEKTFCLGLDSGTGLCEQRQLAPKLTKGSHSRIKYSGYDAGIVSISEDGVATAVGFGTTTVTATTYNKLKAKFKIQVLPAPDALALQSDTLNICAGASFALSGIVPQGTTSAIRFSSDNPACAAVDENGILTAIAEGDARIEGVSFNGLSAECAVHVFPAPGPADLSVSLLSLGVREKSAPLLNVADGCVVNGSVSYSSSKKKVAAVDANGVVTGKKKGSATIKIRFSDGSAASVRVKVVGAPKALFLSFSEIALEAYQSAQLKATIPGKYSGSVQYTSSDEAVATVDGTGLIEAVGVGTATITARLYNGLTSTCQVYVSDASTEIRVEETVTVNAEEYAELPIEVLTTDGDAYKGPVNVTIEPADVAIYVQGKVLGLLAGHTAVLTVSAGKSTETCVITVKEPPAPRKVKAIAHRGGAKWPENSLQAFRNFASTGADGVELDVRSLADGTQVVFHDASFTGSDGVQYTLDTLTLDAIRALKPSICTLDEALDVLASSGKEIYLNPKETADGKKCVESVKSHGLQSKSLYFSANEKVLRQVYDADSSAVLGYTIGSGATATGDAVVNKAKDLHAKYVMIHKSLLLDSIVDYWHEKGYLVCAWTANDMDTIEILCIMDVDAILSDYPEYVVKAR